MAQSQHNGEPASGRQRFRDQVIWITGASSGIGEALALALAQEGARLILSARRLSELERVRDACRGTGGHVLLPLDVEVLEGAAEHARKAVEAFGHVDMVIHSAGISQRSLVKETQLSVDERLMRVNFLGTVALTKALLPHFLARQKGRFVAVSSLVGKFGTPWRSAYSASKHALHGFFDSLRAELAGDGIAVTILCPGFIRTNVANNALTGDGSPLGSMDRAQDEGMPPDIFARKALDALARGRQEVNIGGMETHGVWIKRFFPRLFAYLIQRVKVR